MAYSLRAKGKTGKQALIAMCNNLLKQVFAVVKITPCINQIIVLLTRKKLNFCLVFYTVHIMRRLGFTKLSAN